MSPEAPTNPLELLVPMPDPTAPIPDLGPPHVPGSGTTPNRTALTPLVAACPLHVDSATWSDAAAYRCGLRLYTAGYFWEAHELWEAVWLATSPNSRERHLMAALIQLANASLKLCMHRPRAAHRVMAIAISHLEAAQSSSCRRVLGLEPQRVLAAAKIYEASLSEDAAPAGATLRPSLDVSEGTDG